jgi:hypothetical protein
MGFAPLGIRLRALFLSVMMASGRGRTYGEIVKVSKAQPIGVELIVESCDLVLTAELEPVGYRSGKSRGCENRVLKFLGQILQPRRFVHSSADDCEIKPVVGPDVSEHDFAHV